MKVKKGWACISERDRSEFC